MKKVKKLVLKKTAIANLDDFSMNQLKGGSAVIASAGLGNPFECVLLNAGNKTNGCPTQHNENTCYTCNTCVCQTLYNGGAATNCAPCLTATYGYAPPNASNYLYNC